MIKRYWKLVLAGVVLLVVVIGIFIYGGGNEGIRSYHYLNQEVVKVGIEREEVYVDVMFSDSDKVEIRKAIGRWNKVLNGYREFDIVSEGFNGDLGISREAVNGDIYLILWIPMDSPLIGGDDGEVVLGFTNAIGGSILYLVPDNIGRLSDRGVRIYNVILHEFGHLLGAKHVEGGLMKAKYDIGSFICIDEGTVRQVGAYYGYDWERMNYCVED